MPFIGQEPITGAFHRLDAITTSATATYNLQLNSGAYSPASANHLLVSLNGVIQSPGSSFTISGSQITFASALTSSDSIDFIMAYGDVLNIGTPSDGTVSTNKIANSAVTDAKIAGMAASKLTGALPALDGSSLTGVGGKTEIISSSHTGASAVANVEIDLPTDVKYRSLRLVVTGWYGSAGADLYLRYRRSGQSSIDTSANYHWIFTSSHHSTTNAQRRSSNGDSKARLVWYGCGNAASEAGVFTIDFFDHNSTKKTIAMHKRMGVDSNNDVTTDTGGFRFNYNEAVDRIQLYHGSGTITYGTYTLYGILRD